MWIQDRPSSHSQTLVSLLLYVDHDVRAASRPVKAFVPVQVRLVNPISRSQQPRMRYDEVLLNPQIT